MVTDGNLGLPKGMKSTRNAKNVGKYQIFLSYKR